MPAVTIVGLDLAWGERKPDGLCLLAGNARGARVVRHDLTFGDDDLAAWFRKNVPAGPALVMADGPIVCPNPTGSRPVDRLTHTLFGRFHAACHPANATKCPRPARVAARLGELGFRVGWEPGRSGRLVAEVYPHPAMVRLFGLDRIVKYKKGPVVERRREFRRLQILLRACLAGQFPEVTLPPETRRLLRTPWTKNVEDQTDALFCALIGWRHWRDRGRTSEVIGDLGTGFILLPRADGWAGA
ncbi:MAG: DUF429 domain-containing protein, partial [Limisphaerales bacterium]